MRPIPMYAIAIFAVVIYAGVRRCYPQAVRPERMIVFPLLLVPLGASSLHALFPAGTLVYTVAAALTGSAGVLLGWLHAARWRVQFDAVTRRARVPGDASLLVILLVMFCAKSFLNYSVQSHQPWAATGLFEFLSFAAWGLFAGMPLGRSANVLMRCIRLQTRGPFPPTLQ